MTQTNFLQEVEAAHKASANNDADVLTTDGTIGSQANGSAPISQRAIAQTVKHELGDGEQPSAKRQKAVSAASQAAMAAIAATARLPSQVRLPESFATVHNWLLC